MTSAVLLRKSGQNQQTENAKFASADLPLTAVPTDVDEIKESRKISANEHNISANEHHTSRVTTSTSRGVRPSRLDILDPDSEVCKSAYVGLVRIMHILAVLWVVASPFYTYYEEKTLIDMRLARAAFADFGLLMTMWLWSIVYSYTAYGLHRLRRLGVSRAVVSVLLYLDTLCLVSTCFSVIRVRGWAVFPSVFLMSVTLIQFMKIHSYVSKTLDMELDPAARADGYPEACTLRNFTIFLFVPSLVYDLKYPKAERGFRVKYFLGKLALLFSTLACIFLVASNAVIPAMLRAHQTTYLHTFSKLIVPVFIMDLLFFYTMFECILNLLGELTNYGDREFYEDWWNCTTWEEFARKWNYPVHQFLLTHIYMKIYSNDKKKKVLASVVTFLCSALVHEFFLSATLGFVSWYMFTLMMCQIPLIALSRYHKGTVFGNYYFGFGIIVGVPFLVVLYGTDWSARLQASFGSQPHLE